MNPPFDVGLSAEIDGGVVEFAGLLTGPATRRTDGYVLRIRRGPLIQLDLRRSDKQPMNVERLRFTLSVPLLNYAQVIVPDCGRFFVDKLRSVYLRSSVIKLSAPNDGMPFLALIGQGGEVECAFGLADNLTETTFRGRAPLISSRGALRGGEEALVLEAQKPSDGWKYGRTSSVRESIYLTRKRTSWFHALREYSRFVAHRMKLSYPRSPDAWGPTWCTWTAWPSGEMNEQKVLSNAREASRLGMRTIILDDGWFGQGLDEEGDRLNLGDTLPDRRKFPDLARLVDELHALRLKVLLWYAPLSVSPQSRVYDWVKQLLIETDGGLHLTPNGFHNLCPQNKDARAFVAQEVKRMLRDYGVDGFKTDLYNCLPAEPCRAAHAHDCESAIEGLHRTLRDVWNAVQEVRPDALLELKQNYGNVICAQFGTMVRAGDTAYDMDTNLLRCLHTQAYAPVVHNDYLAWSVHEHPRELAIMLAKQIVAGVPTFSRDLPSLPPSHRRVLSAWLAFYHEHLGLLRGKRQPQGGDLAVWQMGGGRRCILGVIAPAAEVVLPRGATQILVLNGCARSELLLRAHRRLRVKLTARNHYLEPARTRRVTLDGATVVPAPAGGIVELNVVK